MVRLAIKAQSIHSLCNLGKENRLEFKRGLRKYFKTWLLHNASQQSMIQPANDTLALWSVADQNLRTEINGFNFSGIWASYLPLVGEFDPQSFEKLFSATRWVFPRVSGESLKFYEVVDSQSLERNDWGVWEPKADPTHEVKSEDIDGFLVPGLAFSLSGQRLGRGKGYYDRILAKTKGLKVGVCWGHQVVIELPVEPHDVEMNFILTESLIQEG